MELKSWIFCRYGSPTAIIHPKTSLNIDSQLSNALTSIRLIPPIWISHNFKATTLGMTRKTMRNRGFEPWTFRSCLGYQHFVINDNNRDQRKKNSKKTSIATVAEIKTEANVVMKASALVAATDHGGKFLNSFTLVINSAWIIDSGATDHMTFDSRQVSPLRPSSQKIVSTANGNTTPVIGEGSLTLTDTLNLDSVLVVPSLDYNLLSVSQITAALSCIVIFWPEFCVIKDIQIRQTIGCGIKRGKLYYLDLQSKDSNKLQQALMADGSEGEKKKMTWLCLMKTKDEVNLLFQNFHKMIETQYNAKVRVLRSDNGGEYQSSNLQKYLEGHGIIHQTTCSNTPQQNGVAERKNWHLLEVVRASLIAAKTPISYWGEAITSAAYLINRGEYHKEIQTLDYDYHISEENESGQSELVNQEAGELDMSGQQFGSEDVFTEIPNQSSSVEGVLNLEPDPFMKRLPHRHNRGIPKPTYEPELSTKVKYPMSNYVSNHRLSESNKSFVNQLSTIAIPNSVQEALADPRWKAAMNEEMKSLQKNETWELVECPLGKKPVGCRWIYTVKYKADGSIERFKARLVAKGYTQTYGIDYTETFAPVAKINTVRVLLSLAANLDWPLQQFDVKNAFLHGELFEEVYMDLPPGCMVSEKQCQKVCKLKKSLYGLKKSSRAWFGRFTKSMRAFGYRQSNSDHTLFLKKQHGKITALIVYVDDMVVTGTDPEERKALQNYLSREFEMKDLGHLKYFLGIEVSRSSEGIFLSQRKYALDLLQETGMSGCQPVNAPIEEGLKLCVESNQVSTNKGRYQRLVGRLMYLAHTRPDLAYTLSVVSQYMHNPGEQHMNAVMRILRYLKNAPGKGILFAKNVNHQSIEVYTDVVWAGAVDDRRSTSGYFTFVGGNLVTWKSKKQNVVARSSAEAEFRGMALGLCEALWLRLLLQDLGYLSRQPIRLFCDNKAACDIAHNPVQHDRTKHVEVDRFFIKEKLDDKIVELPKIRSKDQLADILTKSVSCQVFSKFLDKLDMCDIYAPT
ncbi:Retrovirus-related Pol polyprotein from transposon RE1 [Vitis vinifera]|uniref:Retrovirus-related Pol polyprotein from transposon RE1 n=1 Tax=Vitis vinifera TaxID=29760 RepID=A0A438C723_VITVI|nr:Retrovirus-related Pol polyprotein from transposon RE1 [Vitis vinifera]